MQTGAPAYAFQDSWELRGSYSDAPLEGPMPEALQREMIRGYRACASYTEAQIGKVLATLEALGLEKNSIVVLWGAHGWHLGDLGMFCKHTNYEQAARAPLIISVGRGAGNVKRGTKTESPSEFVDIFPTLCELAGLPILGNPDAMVHEAALEQFPRDNNKMGYTQRDKRYRYVKWVKMDYSGGERSGPMDSHELYDYSTDPLETINQADNPEYKSVVENFERLF